MEKIIKIRISCYLLEIKTGRKFIAKVLDTLGIIISPYVYGDISAKNSRQIKSYPITLYLDTLSKSSQIFFLRRTNREMKIKKGVRVIPYKNKTPYHLANNSRTKFFVYNSSGSFIKTNLQQSYAQGRIARDDNYCVPLIICWIRFYLFLNSAVRLHAAFITHRRKKESFLLPGNSSVGKTALSNMLKKTGKFNIITDDECFLFSLDRKTCVLNSSNLSNSFNINTVHNLRPEYPSSIFFLKRTEEASKVIPISKKEAFKRICFLSEFPPHEDDTQKGRRMDILKKLVKQCRCNLLINGKDLKDNPQKLNKLTLKGLGGKR